MCKIESLFVVAVVPLIFSYLPFGCANAEIPDVYTYYNDSIYGLFH